MIVGLSNVTVLCYICHMAESNLIRLYLHAPLYYEQVPELFPFECDVPMGASVHGEPAGGESAQELLFCFTLNGEQAESIEPEAEHLLGEMLFAGKGLACLPAAGRQAGRGDVLLPAGRYLFSQRRSALDREKCLALAVEQQKDGLWERLKPENRLYIRRLFEDGSPVTQLFRPFS